MLVDAGKKPKLEALWSGPRASLHTTLDQGSIGWPSRGMLFYKYGLRGGRWLDPCHRRANNLSDALSSSGLGVLKSEALVVVNEPCGPWNENANYDKSQQASLEWLDSTDDGDELFAALYPWMSWCLHSGKLPASYGTPDHCKWVRSQVREFANGGMGAVVELNRWFQLWQRVRPKLPLWGINLFTKLLQCLQKGYYSHYTDVAILADGEAPQPVAIAGEVAARSRSVKGSGGNLERLRGGKCENTTHLTCEILASNETRSCLLLVDGLVQHLELRHNTSIQAMKTAMGRKELNVNLSAGLENGHIAKMAAVFHDEDLLVNAGLISGGSHVSQFLLPEASRHKVLDSIFAFWRKLTALEICLGMLHSHHLPAVAFTQLSANAGVRAEGMTLISKLWKGVESLEASHDVTLQGILSDLEWPQSQWAREICVSAAECGFDFLPSDILVEVEEVSTVASMSKTVEDAFNECRAQTEGVRNGHQTPQAIWHAVAASSLLEEFDINPVRPTAVDVVESPSRLPAEMFKAMTNNLTGVGGSPQR
jgi:hypothetical protein